MKYSITACIIICLGLFPACRQVSKQNKSDHAAATGSQVVASPGDLSVTATFNRNLVGEFMVNSVVTNSSNHATYTDVNIEVSLYNEDSSFLEKIYYMCNDTFPPKSFNSCPFKISNGACVFFEMKIAEARKRY